MQMISEFCRGADNWIILVTD